MQEACTVGVSTDGTASNIAAARLKGLVEKRLDCFFLWMWCLAHRLELAGCGALHIDWS